MVVIQPPDAKLVESCRKKLEEFVGQLRRIFEPAGVMVSRGRDALVVAGASCRLPPLS